MKALVIANLFQITLQDALNKIRSFHLRLNCYSTLVCNLKRPGAATKNRAL